jgi:hypothetical protein
VLALVKQCTEDWKLGPGALCTSHFYIAPQLFELGNRFAAVVVVAGASHADTVDKIKMMRHGGGARAQLCTRLA